MSYNTVTVIGATGTMGANVAGIFASFGNAKVYLIGRDKDRINKTISRIVKSVRADSIRNNLFAADYSMLDECISISDLVFESVVEDLQVKQDIATRVSKSLREDAISCTGTSGLSITQLAECYPPELRGNFFGVHMFNPPYNLPLCELISTEYSNIELCKDLKNYLSKTLLRTVVMVKDTPAFLGNRIGFQFINEALQYAEKYSDNGGIDYIDAILGQFTGRSMPPLVTSDFVGLDVHKAIVDNLYKNTNDYANDTFVLPTYVVNLISKGKLGRKTGAGLYQMLKYDSGLRRLTVYDIASGEYRDQIPYIFPFVEKMKGYLVEGEYIKAFQHLTTNHSQEAEICLSFLLKYVVYSLYTADKIAENIESADDVMATGFNWCPPLAMYQVISSVADVSNLVKQYLPGIYAKVDVGQLFDKVKPSKYDFRPYFRSGR